MIIENKNKCLEIKMFSANGVPFPHPALSKWEKLNEWKNNQLKMHYEKYDHPSYIVYNGMILL